MSSNYQGKGNPTGDAAGLLVFVLPLLMDYFFRIVQDNADDGNGKIEIQDLCDDVRMVDELKPSVLIDWFKKNNPDGRFSNIAIQPGMQNLIARKLSNVISEPLDNLVFQILFDDHAKKIKDVHAVSYDTMQSGLKQIFEKAGGVLQLEE